MSKFLKISIILTIMGISICLFYNKQPSNKEISSPKNITKIEKDSQDIKSKKSITKSQNNNKQKVTDYNLLIKSDNYNAIVSLNEDTKEVNVEVLEDPSSATASNNYITLSEEDINYLKENSDIILSELKEGNLSQKYNIVTDMLEKYETDLTVGDLISLGFKYLK